MPVENTDSWIRDEGQLLTAIIVARLSAIFPSVSQAPIPTEGCEEDPVTPAYASGFYFRRVTGAGWGEERWIKRMYGEVSPEGTEEHSFWKRMERGRMWNKTPVK